MIGRWTAEASVVISRITFFKAERTVQDLNRQPLARLRLRTERLRLRL